MDVANGAGPQDSEARNNDIRCRKLAALGRAVESISDLKATVQRDTGATWFLRVGTTYTGEGPFTVVLCDLMRGEWWFSRPDGSLVGPADDVMGCAEMIRAAARGVPAQKVRP